MALIVEDVIKDFGNVDHHEASSLGRCRMSSLRL